LSRLTIGTRGSALALWQARHVADRLRAIDPTLDVDLNVIKTRGDKILNVPLAMVGGKGLFVKEIEEALLAGDADVAVHSIKDVPAELPPGLHLGAIPQREDPRDALVSRSGSLQEIPTGGRIGTSSLRRTCLLSAIRPDIEICGLRGNVNTRLRKLDEGQFDAVVLAAAGLKRLGFEDRITQYLEFPWLPAVGQGALGLETRIDDERTDAWVQQLHHRQTALCVGAERALLRRLEGGCQVPIAAHATLSAQVVSVQAMVGHPSGSPVFRGRRQGPADQAAALGDALAGELLEQGAREVLAQLEWNQVDTSAPTDRF